MWQYAERYNLSTAPQNKLASNVIQRLHRANACDHRPLLSHILSCHRRTKSVCRVGSFVRKCYLAGERSVIPCRQCENNTTSRHSSSKLTSVETAARARARRAGMKERILQEKVDGNGWSLECGAEQKKHTGRGRRQPAQSGSRVSMCINRGSVNHAYVFLVFGGHQVARRPTSPPCIRSTPFPAH